MGENGEKPCMSCFFNVSRYKYKIEGKRSPLGLVFSMSCFFHVSLWKYKLETCRNPIVAEK